LELRNCKKILIIRLSSLGDILLTTPLLRSIKNQYPGIEIDMLLRYEYREILLYNPYLARLLLLERTKTNEAEIFQTINAAGYDLIIDLQNNIRTTIILRKQKMNVISFKKRRLDKFLLVNFKINRMKNLPPIPERYAETINGLTLDDEGLDLFIPEELKPQKVAENTIAFCPGARHFTKRWLFDYFVEFGKMLIRDKYGVALIGGRSDAETCKKLNEEIPGSINLCKEDGILQVASDLKSCIAAVCNDSGLMHTACAVKTPVLAFYGSTVKEFGFTPYKNKNIIFENDNLSCRPCSHIGKSSCPKKHFRCMKDLTPESAYKSLLKLLQSE